jgi:hypothetical protein
MTGGLLQLTYYGSQNVILSGNPDMTYFYKTFKKYTHFSQEIRSKLMDGPTDYPYDAPVQLRARIDRVGDLLSDLVFSFQLPAIYSKSRPTSVQQEFQWVRAVGAAAIQTVSISVGPNKIQEFTGEYLMSRALLDYPADHFAKWQQLVGDVPNLTDPAIGDYGFKTASSAEYPTVYFDSRSPAGGQTNVPSIPATTVYVPIPFWFTEQGQALPLVGLQYYTVDVTITLAPSRTLYTTLDAGGVRMAPGFTLTGSTLVNTPTFTNVSDSDTQIRNFLTDSGTNPPPLNTWAAAPTIHSTYVFLPEAERTVFATTPLMYLLRQVTLVPFPEILGNQLLDLEIHNPITRLVILPRRSDSVFYRNALLNFTNWWNWPYRPKNPTQETASFLRESASGVAIPASQMDIIQSLRVLADGNEVQEVKAAEFFTRLVPFRTLSGGADRKIPVYSFELTSPGFQPSGSLNASRIHKFQLDLGVWPLPQASSYIYSLNVYVENLNFFLIESGMGDVKYAL